MPIGARVLKTGFGVTLALIICQLLNIESASSFAAITVVINMQPSVNKTVRNAWKLIKINVVAVSIATFFGFFHWNNPLIIGTAVILIIIIANHYGWKKEIPQGIVSIIFIMDAPTNQFLIHAATRSLSIFIGLGIALVINRILVPPRYKEILIEKLQTLFADSSAYFFQSIRSFVEITYMTEYTKTDVQDLEKRIEEILQIHEHAREEFAAGDNALLVEKMIEICQGFVERGQNIEEMTYQRLKRRLSPDSPLQSPDEISPSFKRLLDFLLLGNEQLVTLTQEIFKNLNTPHSSILPQTDHQEYWAQFNEAMEQWQSEVSGVFYLRAMMEVAVVTTEMRWASRRLKRIYSIGSFTQSEF